MSSESRGGSREVNSSSAVGRVSSQTRWWELTQLTAFQKVLWTLEGMERALEVYGGIFPRKQRWGEQVYYEAALLHSQCHTWCRLKGLDMHLLPHCRIEFLQVENTNHFGSHPMADSLTAFRCWDILKYTHFCFHSKIKLELKRNPSFSLLTRSLLK